MSARYPQPRSVRNRVVRANSSAASSTGSASRWSAAATITRVSAQVVLDGKRGYGSERRLQQEPHVDESVRYRADDLPICDGPQLDGQPGVLVAKPTQNRREAVRDDRFGGSDGHLAGGFAAVSGDRRGGRGQVEHSLRQRHQAPADLSETCPTGQPVEQRGSYDRLERPNVHGDRRLGEVQGIGGRGDAARPCHRRRNVDFELRSESRYTPKPDVGAIYWCPS